MLFNVENWNISSLVFGLILATGLAVYAVYTLVTSKKHLREKGTYTLTKQFIMYYYVAKLILRVQIKGLLGQ